MVFKPARQRYKCDVKIIHPIIKQISPTTGHYLGPFKPACFSHWWRRKLIVNFSEWNLKVKTDDGFYKFVQAKFKWYPTYSQLCEIYRGLQKCEELNEELDKVWLDRSLEGF